MDESAGFCRKCNGHFVDDVGTSSKQVVMLYDVERAQHILSGASLVGLSQDATSEPGEIGMNLHITGV